MYVCIVWAQAFSAGTHGSQKVSDPLSLELQHGYWELNLNHLEEQGAFLILFSLLVIFYFMCVSVSSACMSVMCVQCLSGPEEGTGFSGTGVTDGWL